jgi:hypothetical protein
VLRVLVRESRLSRYVRVGDRRAYVDKEEPVKLLELRKDKPTKS